MNAPLHTRSASRSRLALRRGRPGAGRASAPDAVRLGGPVLLFAFSLAALGAGAGRALTTTYLPVLLERIHDAPSLIGAVMTVNAIAGFVVPIGVGVWSDRRGRRLPFIVGGAALTAGGLVAVGLGNGTSYLALGLAAGLVYMGLNALTTAHRAIVAEDVEDGRRPAATSAQEIAGLVGAVVAVAIGGALIEPAPAAAFALAAVVLAASALPTLLVTRRLRLGERAGSVARRARRASVRDVLRRPGAREILVAQTLWVFGYAALPAFFVLYAEDSLGLGVGAAGALPLGFGALTALGMVLAGRARPERVHTLLLAGAALLGTGLLAAAPATSLAAATPAFAAAALGAGLVTALGFAYFARFVPEGQAGRYSGVFFAGRAVASASALPLAGLAVELSGSYRAVLWLGAAALVALVPLGVAGRGARRERAEQDSLRARPATVAAVIPVFASDRAVDVARVTLRHVDQVVLVDDGAPPQIARSLDGLAGDDRVRIRRLGANGGKGSAVAAGTALLLGDPNPPEAVVVLDSDGQHDPDRIPAFLEASRRAEVVVGDRRDRSSMPLARQIGNRAASLALLLAARAWVPDTQNGMRLFRTAALRAIPPTEGGYEAESRHLRALLASGRRVASVEIPTIYDGEPSHFHPLVDTVRVARALLAPRSGPDPASGSARDALAVLRGWGPRLAALLLAAIALGAALPAFQPLDSSLMLAVNGLGDGPEWLYQALDPHTRNYILLLAATVIAAAIALRRPRHVLGAALGVVLAAYLAGAALEVVKLFIERARPEEVLGAQVQLSHGRSWAHLASYPSGHLIVTAAMASAAAAAVPALRGPLLAYVALVGITRVTFGAHFPLDVIVGAAMGYELGLFTARLMASARLLPAPEPALEWAEARLPLRVAHQPDDAG
jgi:membrane-associated phospholipid phosphatase/MFS family permease